MFRLEPPLAAVKDIDIYIADILGQKYRYRIDIGYGDIDPPLVRTVYTCYYVFFDIFVNIRA